jgi:hypothetical protein
VYKSVWTNVFISLGYIPRCGAVGSHGDYVHPFEELPSVSKVAS